MQRFFIVFMIMTLLIAGCAEPEKFETQKPELMNLNRHSLMVPEGTQIGDKITVHDGIWLSKQACAGMLPYLMLLEKQTGRPK